MTESSAWIHDEEVGVTGAVLVLKDMRERQRAEAERRRLEARLQQMEKLESLGLMAGGIAHDFNNILAAVIGHIDLALQDLPGDSAARGDLEHALTGARRAAELAHQMLAYCGKARFHLEPVQLSLIAQEMLDLLRVAISPKCRLQHQLAEDLPLVHADPTQLRQVIMNLVINAAEAIGNGEGVVTIRTGQRTLDQPFLAECYLDENLPAGAYVFLEVSDTGCGMTPETLAKIFDPFFSTKFTGRGLGLATVLGIIRSHRGAIRVHSEPGRGTTFQVFLPVAPPAPQAGPRDSAAATWRGSGTALVVDDDAASRRLTQKMLENLGFQVLSAADGPQGIEVFRSQADQIGVVLLDLLMPGIGGLETLRELRQLRLDIPVILISGYSEQAVSEPTPGNAPVHFLAKPFDLRQLTQALRHVLEPGRDTRS